MFSAGVILYDLLTGYHVFDGNTYEEVLENNKIALIEYPESYWKQISKEGLDLTKRMLKDDPD
jgi:predicted RNase H-like HicB family nuclease